jgi:hypothetical protein
MKFTKRNDRVSSEGVRPGFNDSDITFLSKQIHTPRTQIFSYEELESAEPEDRHYFCAMCKSKLDYSKYLEAYECKECVQYYDVQNLQDKPLTDIEDFKLVPYGAQRHYPEFDAEDPHTPFVETVDLNDTNEEIEGVEVRSYDNGRIKHINIHNVTFADAIRFDNVLSAKKKSEDEL